ncbi:4-hydroxybenzoate octaprenyltransferase [Nisaea acidiphila]|uniref:4-hydroxybenzoate octaprenyltransferase n=1 Tax=Nisaea acidiphila TaxID=1862145 RepID=A0A9J7AYV5_9PROT|nr:4-hydroxybenzoate octaprenyltransferase [Nisaea acidiphila]UUX51970.1 4-hydroxybenzoate octaprenyltransferase [Nisaea acidiphila]
MTASDIARNDWVDRLLPTGLRPYARLMRLDRPIGTWLLLLPCWWGLALGWQATDKALPVLDLIWLYILFSLGATIMRGAGCTINDLWDRDFDRQVARTVERPIANGDLSVRQALAFLVLQLGAGLLILLQLNRTCWLLGVLVLVLVVTYPLFKRVTYWPQFVLGLTFNWGALMGWAAVTGDIQLANSVLYVAGIVWTLGYDTIYAHQDKEDDVLIGVKSSALALGERTVPFLWAVYPLTLAGIAMSGALVGLGWPFYLLLGAAGAQLLWQIRTIDIDDPKGCLLRFRSNRYFGWIVTLAILLG